MDTRRKESRAVRSRKLDLLEGKVDRGEQKLEILEGKADRQEEKLDRHEEKLDRLVLPVPLEGSIATQKGNGDNLTASVGVTRGVDNMVYLRGAVDIPSAALDEETGWSGWEPFGRPGNALGILEVSLDIAYDEDSHTYGCIDDPQAAAAMKYAGMAAPEPPNELLSSRKSHLENRCLVKRVTSLSGL